MKLTEAAAKELGMVRDSRGNWATARYTTFVESTQRTGGSNAGMARGQQAAPGAGAKRSATHEQSIASIRESCLAAGMSAAEADRFLRIGECRG
jgi:hypothetical protein